MATTDETLQRMIDRGWDELPSESLGGQTFAAVHDALKARDGTAAELAAEM